MANVTITPTVLTARPAVLIALTNEENVPRKVRVVRTASVGEVTQVRWLYDLELSASGVLSAIDDEAPLGRSFQYQLYVDDAPHATTASITLSGPWTADGVATWAWLRHLTAPALSQPVLISSLPELSREGRYGQHVPIGSSLPVVTTAPRAGRAGEMVLVTLGASSATAMAALVNDGSVLQLATEPRFNVASGGMYLAVLNATEIRPVDDGTSLERLWRLNIVEVNAPPAAGQQGALRTYNDVLLENATYGELLARRDAGWDYLTVLTGISTDVELPGAVVGRSLTARWKVLVNVTPPPGGIPYPSASLYPSATLYPDS